MTHHTRLTPVRDLKVYRRNLPHWENPGSVYYITFRTAGELTLSDTAKGITLSSIKFHADHKYRLHSCVVMGTHVHIILQPLEESEGSFCSLAQIMHSIKSYSANRIQRMLNRTGPVWLDESYDRIVRDDEEYIEKMNYVVYNPVRAGLVQNPEDYKWLFVQGMD